MGRECHPALKGIIRGDREKKKLFRGSFSSREMEALAAICETVFPPLSGAAAAGTAGGEFEGQIDREDEAVRFFYESSGSQAPVPQEVAELLGRRGLLAAVILARAVLLVLSTRLGTLLLCGSLCVGGRWPYVNTFSSMGSDQREKVLQGWLKHRFLTPIRLAFVYLKVLCLYVLLSRVDEKGENPLWKAIGYQVDEEQEMSKPDQGTPLEKGIIETIYSTDLGLLQSLKQKGLEVTQDSRNKIYRIKCDAVIVGSGCGGGVAAAVLAGCGYKVVVLEKGNYYTHKDYSSLEGPSMDQLYESGGILPSCTANVLILAGSTVGGGSAVNWSASIRTPHAVLQDWAEKHGMELFGSKEYASAMDIVCKRIGVTDRCVEQSFQNKVLQEGCEKLGLEINAVPRNSSEDHYCGSCGYGCRRGDKQGTDYTWLVDAVNCGAVILSGCKAEQLVFETNAPGRARRKKCTGVRAKSMNSDIENVLQFEAKVTVSACGALLTPPLLISSGLKNKHIGRNLHLHPVAMAWGHFPQDSSSQLSGTSYQGGIITLIHKVVEGNSNPNVQAIIETPLLGPATFTVLCPWESGLDIKDRLAKYARTAHLLTIVRDRGHGEVTREGIINYKMDSVDKENIRAGLRQSLRILIAAGADEVGTHRSDGLRMKCRGGTASEYQVEEFLDRVSAEDGPLAMDEKWAFHTSAHQMGSCRMGINEKEGAVDKNGESWEAEGLFVCDASVLPTAVGVNPMITIESTAYCIANRIAEYLSKQGLLKSPKTRSDILMNGK
ncbi:hypothetical protein ACJRO7_031789 [Eucalyptus globulus]|uniref:Long-chain-alcohol oxidase n=2 Tax=Eucalyptus globulus TaxID=34317 RepID=A0ABD3JRJ1_EUCGL